MATRERPRRSSTIAGAIKGHDPIRIRALGLTRRPTWEDSYHAAMRMGWTRLAGVIIATFVAFNLVFAALYWIDPGALANPHEVRDIPRYWRDFFFSVQTVATIGYGNPYPISLYANILVVIEISLGILLFAVVTGLVFARFSRPTARILFSRAAVIRDLDGIPTLMLRAANQRHNLIYSAEVTVSLFEDGVVGGSAMRQFQNLKVVRDSNPLFALTWTVMHPIDDDSPLKPWLEFETAPEGAEIVVVLSGFDESSGETIYGRWAYAPEDLVWNGRFVDILGLDEHGTRTIDYAKFHEVEREPGL